MARNLQEIIPAFFVGPNGEQLTPDQIKQRQSIAESLMAQATDTSPNAGGWLSVAAKGMQGLAAGRQRNQADEAVKANALASQERMSSLLGSLGGPGGLGGAASQPLFAGATPSPVDRAPIDPISNRVAQAHGAAGSGILPSTMLSALDSTEGGGAYDTLFGYANRSGPFAGVDVSQMSVGDALAFADPRGQYAQHVKGQIGRVATPMGRHQIVGTTLRNAVNQLGIDPSTPFNSTTQDAIALHLAKNRVNSASSLDGKISALRSEWEGFKSVPRDQMAQIVAEIEAAPDAAQVLRGVSLPAGIDPQSLVGRPLPEGIGMEPMAYAPVSGMGAEQADSLVGRPLPANAGPETLIGRPLPGGVSPEVVGALASAPFPSAGLPEVPFGEEVIVAETPEEIMAAEAAMNSPEFAQPVDYMSLPENQLTMTYADEAQPGGNPNGIMDLGPGRPGEKRRGPDGQMYQLVETTGMTGSSGGSGWIRVADDGGMGGGLSGEVAPNDPGIWGMGMDPNDPSTIPAMAGGTLDVISGGGGGSFPAAPGAVQQGGMGGINPAIVEALSSPYASPQERQIASLLLGEQMKAQDPMRQLQLQKMQAEVEQMRTGTPGARSSFGNLDAQARAAGLVPGSPEYKDFMLHGGGAPATFRALDMQAKAAGFTPGTPEYNEFMATRGAGLQAGAAQTAKNVADIESGGAAAGAIDLGKASIKAGTDAWADYGKLQTSIGNLDEAIAAIDSGAQSGAIYKLLPNITEASASLQNAMDRMGLDVIGSVTFGALSEAEMRLAMQTAAPRDLAPADLRNWLVRKREAQAKAADMLADAAQFLTRPGNTINGWIEKNRAAKEAAPISATPPMDANKPVADMTDEELEAFINGN